MSGPQSSRQLRETHEGSRNTFGDWIEESHEYPHESKIQPDFAEEQNNGINKGTQVAADTASYTDVEKGKRDGVRDGDLSSEINRQIPAETAADYGLDQETAHRVLCDAAASEKARQHADADSILGILNPQQIAAVVDSSTVGSLYRRFHVLMRELVLPAKGFTSEDQAQIASHLSGTDTELRKHLAKLDIDWPKPNPSGLAMP